MNDDDKTEATTNSVDPELEFRLKPGDVVSKLYKVLDLIGVGGMSTVYRCEDLSLGRIVALKTIQSGLTPQTLRRLQTEGKAIARLEHSNIVKVFGVQFIEDSIPCLVMEFVPGITLATLLERQGALPVMRTLRIASQICDGLKAAEREGIIHRDLKPANIMILNSGTLSESVKILDFGIAKIQGDLPVGATRTGEVVGTPKYMSPEQALGKKCDGRSDQYSLGCVLYEMLTGKPPFEADNGLSMMIAHLQEPVPDVGKAAKEPLPRHLEQAITKLLQKDPQDRFATMAEASSALLETPNSTRRWQPRTVAILIASFALISGLTIFAVGKLSEPKSVPVPALVGQELATKPTGQAQSDATVNQPTAMDQKLLTPEGLSEYIDLRKLSFVDQNRISDIGLGQIGKLKKLKDLNLRGCRLVTSAGVAKIKNLQLECLDLSRTGVNDDVGETLADMTSLQQLSLSDTAASSHTCRWISGLPHLINLSMLGTRVNGRSLAYLAQLRNLKALNLAYNDVKGSLSELTSSGISILDLRGCALTSEDFSDGLAKLKSLDNLNLSETNVAGSNLDWLVRLKDLEIRECNNLTESDINNFQLKAPLCDLHLKPTSKASIGPRPFGKELVVNGDFEEGAHPALWLDSKAGQTAIPGWTIVKGSVGLMGPYIKAEHGTNCIELNGDQPGAIKQTIATTSGAHYLLSFYGALNPDWDGYGSMRVQLPGCLKNYTFKRGLSQHQRMIWEPISIPFTAKSQSTEVSFISTNPGVCGVFIDNVSVRSLVQNSHSK